MNSDYYQETIFSDNIPVYHVPTKYKVVPTPLELPKFRPEKLQSQPQEYCNDQSWEQLSQSSSTTARVSDAGLAVRRTSIVSQILSGSVHYTDELDLDLPLSPYTEGSSRHSFQTSEQYFFEAQLDLDFPEHPHPSGLESPHSPSRYSSHDTKGGSSPIETQNIQVQRTENIRVNPFPNSIVPNRRSSHRGSFDMNAFQRGRRASVTAPDATAPIEYVETERRSSLPDEVPNNNHPGFGQRLSSLVTAYSRIGGKQSREQN